MPKQVKSLKELHAMVEAEVRKHPEFNEVSPNRPYWHERDADGCNWNLNFWSGPNHLVTDASEAVRAAVMRMRLQYDAPEKS